MILQRSVEKGCESLEQFGGSFDWAKGKEQRAKVETLNEFTYVHAATAQQPFIQAVVGGAGSFRAWKLV